MRSRSIRLSVLRVSRLTVSTLTLSMLTITACTRERAASTLDSGAETLDVAPTPQAVTMSRFDIPLDYDFTPILQIVENVVPKTFGSLDELHVVGDDSSKHYAYTATRGSFTATADGPIVRLRTTLAYAARGWYKPPIGPTLSAGCGTGDGDERPRIIVELTAPLTLTPDWHLTSQAKLGRMAPASDDPRDRCMVSIIRYDVTDRVIDAARSGIRSQLPKIDAKVRGVSLTKQATHWWTMLNRPIHLADSVWLLLQPKQIRLGHIDGAGHVVTVQAGLDAFPRIVTGKEPKIDQPPLPPLAHDSVGDGFHIVLDGLVDYPTATRGVTAALAGQQVTQAGRTVRVKTVEVVPKPRGRLALTVTFDGDAEGELQFIGSPVYDRARNMMTVPDLDYDLDTDSQLINAYAWLRSDALRELFRDKAQVSVTPALDQGKRLLLLGLNRKLGDAVTLSADVDSVAVRGVYVTQPGIVVRAEATGQAGMAVKQRVANRK